MKDNYRTVVLISLAIALLYIPMFAGGKTVWQTAAPPILILMFLGANVWSKVRCPRLTNGQKTVLAALDGVLFLDTLAINAFYAVPLGIGVIQGTAIGFVAIAVELVLLPFFAYQPRKPNSAVGGHQIGRW